MSACLLCDIAGLEVSEPRAVEDTVVICSDQVAVVFVETGAGAVTVAPCAHVASLAELQPSELGAFLAALQRTVSDVQTTLHCAGATISPTIDAAGRFGRHVRFHVVPTESQEPTKGNASEAPGTRLNELPELLRRLR